MHREVMLSKAYRQSSAWNDDAGKVDGDSRLLWRFPPRRLSAEEIRDTLLSVSGKLNLEMGGPGFRLYKFMQDNVCTYEPLDEHGPETYRRRGLSSECESISGGSHDRIRSGRLFVFNTEAF